MARSNGSTALWPRSGLMPIPITVTKPAPRPTRTGCITIITTAPTLVSEAQRPQIAFTTSRGTTDSSARDVDLPQQYNRGRALYAAAYRPYRVLTATPHSPQ